MAQGNINFPDGNFIVSSGTGGIHAYYNGAYYPIATTGSFSPFLYVNTTGTQTISGAKNFASHPQYDGVDLFASSGNQNIAGTVTMNSGFHISGNKATGRFGFVQADVLTAYGTGGTGFSSFQEARSTNHSILSSLSGAPASAFVLPPNTRFQTLNTGDGGPTAFAVMTDGTQLIQGFKNFYGSGAGFAEGDTKFHSKKRFFEYYTGTGFTVSSSTATSPFNDINITGTADHLVRLKYDISASGGAICVMGISGKDGVLLKSVKPQVATNSTGGVSSYPQYSNNVSSVDLFNGTLQTGSGYYTFQGEVNVILNPTGAYRFYSNGFFGTYHIGKCSTLEIEVVN